MTLKIGRKQVAVASLEDAAEKYSDFRDHVNSMGPEAPNTPEGTVLENGKPVARISYNGRVWPVVESASWLEVR